MKALHFAFRALWHRKATSFFVSVIWALGMIGLAMTTRLERTAEAQLTRTLEGTDLLLAAKGSPTQAILAHVFHRDQASGNISIAEAEKWLSHPDLSHVRRLAYGDNYQGYRILGSDSATWNGVSRQPILGRWPEGALEVVLPRSIAERQGLALGDHFHGSHGAVDDLGDHDEHHYTVVGIATPDQAFWNEVIWTSLESVWAVHEHSAPEYTAVLARIESPMTRLMLPGQIQRQSPLMAVSPAMEANRMVGWMNQGGAILRLISWLLTGIASLSMFLLLQSHIRERLGEYALVRAMGGTWGQIAALVLGQNLLLALLAFALTYATLALAYATSQWWLPAGFSLYADLWWDLQPDQLWWVLHLFLALFAGLGPWVWLQKIPLHRALVDS
jgi:putative ABC transport system permease protein